MMTTGMTYDPVGESVYVNQDAFMLRNDTANAEGMLVFNADSTLCGTDSAMGMLWYDTAATGSVTIARMIVEPEDSTWAFDGRIVLHSGGVISYTDSGGYTLTGRSTRGGKDEDPMFSFLEGPEGPFLPRLKGYGSFFVDVDSVYADHGTFENLDADSVYADHGAFGNLDADSVNTDHLSATNSGWIAGLQITEGDAGATGDTTIIDNPGVSDWTLFTTHVQIEDFWALNTFNLPHSTNLSWINSVGEFGDDSDDRMLVAYDTTFDAAVGISKVVGKTMPFRADTTLDNDTLCFVDFDDLEFPQGYKIAKLKVTLNSALVDTLIFLEWSGTSTYAVVDTLVVASGITAENVTGFNDSDIAADSRLCVVFKTSPTVGGVLWVGGYRKVGD